MGYAFKAMFAFFTQLFSAAEKGASALNHLATWADEAAGTFADKARHDRQEDIKKLLKEAGITALPKAGETAVPVASAPATAAP
jgi:uncharacterized protein with GYD domain